MTQANGPRTEVRPGWVVPCPLCGEPNRYTTFRVDPPTPFFYETIACDVLLRTSDEQRVPATWAPKPASDEELERVWLDILTTAPLAPSGGTFSLWANIHCPVCRREIPYNLGLRDLHVRLYDAYIVAMDGAHVVTDEDMYVVKIDPVRSRDIHQR
jgi:hypothetical protein